MALRYLVQLPFDAVRSHAEWCGGRPLRDWAIALEDAGFHGAAVTDHPFPPDEWLTTGGHHAFDPFVLLTAFGEATTELRLITDVVVAGYRNPYLLAKAVATLDVLSGGRVVVGMAAGYLREEFDALGASFSDRGKRFDDALDAMRAALTGEPVRRDGYYPAQGNRMLPVPAQAPHPPVWIGGNSDAAIRRAVHLADGWMPFPQAAARADRTGTPALESVDQLRARIGEATAMRAETGRPPLDICSPMFGAPADASALADAVDEYEDAGVTWLSVPISGPSMEAALARVDEVGAALHRHAG